MGEKNKEGRINLMLGEMTAERIKGVAKRLGLSVTMFIRVAVDIFGWILTKKSEGKRIIAEDKDGNKEELFIPFSNEQ